MRADDRDALGNQQLLEVVTKIEVLLDCMLLNMHKRAESPQKKHNLTSKPAMAKADSQVLSEGEVSPEEIAVEEPQTRKPNVMDTKGSKLDPEAESQLKNKAN